MQWSLNSSSCCCFSGGQLRIFSSGLHGMAIGHPNVLILTPVVVGLPSHSVAVHTNVSQKTDHPSIPSSATANLKKKKKDKKAIPVIIITGSLTTHLF